MNVELRLVVPEDQPLSEKGVTNWDPSGTSTDPSYRCTGSIPFVMMRWVRYWVDV